ncbi:hypothetical protein AVEN_228887-1 [Araneus ventricosus]|uniref:Uncharacterized protein n=1 Tax=Araneus ventricosus TaxID=182803 RepID=A0A4Y2NTM5_ARAVE|nr:hypothetical protein AVEN_228887-1 [Araneus ventricosus]
MAVRRQQENFEESQVMVQANAKRSAEQKQSACASKAMQRSLSAYKYNSNCAYESERVVNIGPMPCIFSLCGAKKWHRESPGLCCSSGKVQLSLHQEPPEPLKSFNRIFIRFYAFKKIIQVYNSAFCMTSFGSNIISEGGFTPTFKAKGVNILSIRFTSTFD